MLLDAPGSFLISCQLNSLVIYLVYFPTTCKTIYVFCTVRTGIKSVLKQCPWSLTFSEVETIHNINLTNNRRMVHFLPIQLPHLAVLLAYVKRLCFSYMLRQSQMYNMYNRLGKRTHPCGEPMGQLTQFTLFFVFYAFYASCTNAKFVCELIKNPQKYYLTL